MFYLHCHRSYYHKIKTLALTMNTAFLDHLLRLMNLIFTRGHSPILKLARSHAVVDINQEMLLALSKEHWNRLKKVYVMLRRNQLSGKNVASSTVHLNGLRVNGVNARRPVVKMELKPEKFIVKNSVPTGKP